MTRGKSPLSREKNWKQTQLEQNKQTRSLIMIRAVSGTGALTSSRFFPPLVAAAAECQVFSRLFCHDVFVIKDGFIIKVTFTE